MQSLKKITIFLVIIMILVSLAVWGMKVKVEAPTVSAGVITSFTLGPDKAVIKKDGWLMYIKGARAVLIGQNIKSAEVRAMPTGAGVGEEYPDGVLLGAMSRQAGTSSSETWTFNLPPDILATNLFAVATDTAGNALRSADLGSVGYDTDAQKAVDEGHQPW